MDIKNFKKRDQIIAVLKIRYSRYFRRNDLNTITFLLCFFLVICYAILIAKFESLVDVRTT